MEPPKGVDIIVMNPPFEKKQQFFERCYELGLPAYILCPLNSMARSSLVDLFNEKGVEVFLLPGGSSTQEFYSVQKGRPVNLITPCCWYGINTRAKKGEHKLFFLGSEE